MKGIAIIKDLIISVLIVLCIILILSVIFYDEISLSKIVPESEDYLLSDEMQEAMEDETLEETQEVVTKYYIDAADLKKYEKTKEYNKGKKNPFAVEALPTDNNVITDGNNNDSNGSTTNESGNFYEDEGIK